MMAHGWLSVVIDVCPFEMWHMLHVVILGPDMYSFVLCKGVKASVDFAIIF